MTLVSFLKTKDKQECSWRASVDQKPHSLESLEMCHDFFPQFVPQGGPLSSPRLVGTLHHPKPSGVLAPLARAFGLSYPTVAVVPETRPALDEHHVASSIADVLKIFCFTTPKPLAGLPLRIRVSYSERNRGFCFLK